MTVFVERQPVQSDRDGRGPSDGPHHGVHARATGARAILRLAALRQVGWGRRSQRADGITKGRGLGKISREYLDERSTVVQVGA
jgi:hypothetical protein